MAVWFRPTKIGKWDVACAELCGNNHTTMKSVIEVVSQADWDAWVREKSGEKTGAIDRAEAADNAWKHWFKQGMRPAIGGALSHDWNGLRIEKSEALKALAGSR
jgi:heme/copper-type cytochrome/quinol oxidase subunit 2